MPVDVRTKIVLVDRHAVAAASVRLTRDTAVLDAVPRLEPTTVTLIAPVTAMFVGSADDGYGPSNVTVADRLPSCVAVVATMLRLGSTPRATLLTIADVDVHNVPSDPLACTRSLVDMSIDDEAWPTTVTD
jgi:hypothetical protein